MDGPLPYSMPQVQYQMTATEQLGPAAPSRGGSGIVTPAMVDLMCATRGWALAMAVVGWLTAGLGVVGAISLIVLSVWVDGGALMRLFAWPYLAVALLMMVPAVLLTRYVRALTRLREQRSERPLAEALNHERRLWKFTAIGVLILLCMSIGGVLIAVAIPALLK